MIQLTLDDLFNNLYGGFALFFKWFSYLFNDDDFSFIIVLLIVSAFFLSVNAVVGLIGSGIKGGK